ncbi:MAG: FHA domain-containing protein, partial [Deltaproteobacteria bacterium]|nr:FHA domain-containing protein [Deltaproteobacteria bacterium]
MFKLTVVGGPAKGKSYQLREGGETSVGRVDGNDVVLTSQKVSKKHCVLVVSNSSVTVKDAGSSNGTFVNGILTKLKIIKPGDRVSVGEFVLELVKVDPPKPKALPSNVIPMNPGGLPGMGASGPAGGQAGGTLGQGVPVVAAPPQNLVEKVKFLFEQNVINFVYNLNEKHEWHAMMGGMFGLLVIAGAIAAVYPVLDHVDEKLTNETAGRALLLARQMVDRNAGFIFDKQDAKIDIGYVEKESGVMSTYIIDMDQRVLAPGRLLNQSISDADQGVFASKAVKAFHDNEAKERMVIPYGNMVAAAVPLRIFSAAAGKNVTVAVGLVYFDK